MAKTKSKQTAEIKFKKIIRDLHGAKVYPSAYAINVIRDKGKAYGLSGRECRWRREVFRELGLSIKSGPYAKYADRGPGYNEVSY